MNPSMILRRRLHRLVAWFYRHNPRILRRRLRRLVTWFYRHNQREHRNYGRSYQQRLMWLRRHEKQATDVLEELSASSHKSARAAAAYAIGLLHDRHWGSESQYRRILVLIALLQDSTDTVKATAQDTLRDIPIDDESSRGTTVGTTVVRQLGRMSASVWRVIVEILVEDACYHYIEREVHSLADEDRSYQAVVKALDEAYQRRLRKTTVSTSGTDDWHYWERSF